MCDEEKISKLVTQALSKSPAWSTGGHLILRPEWHPLVPRRWRRLPTERAIYIIGITDAVKYEAGVSQVIYIGSSTNLSRRITQHRSAKTRSALKNVIDAFETSLQIAWWPLPDFHRDWLRGIEAEALWLFEEQFGTLPIGNLDIPNTDAVEYCRGLVELRDWSSDQSSLSISEIGEKTGTIPEVEEREPYSGGITIRLFIGKPDETTLRRMKFRHIRFFEPHVHSARYSPKEEEPEECNAAQQISEMELYSRSLVHDVNLASWSKEKMTQVIEIACRMELVQTKTKLLRKFATSDRSVPLPHTWGEVALIAARLLAGSWQPEERAWVQIVFAKEVLGEARLNQGWYVGEDKSDVPQLKQLRARVKGPNDDMQSIKFEDPSQTEQAYGLEISHEDTSVTRENEERLTRAFEQAARSFQNRIEAKVRVALRGLSFQLPDVFKNSRM